MKFLFNTVFLAHLSLIAVAQQATVSSGGDATGSTGSVSFSIGQVSYGSAQATAGNINQGVQQPYLIVTSLSEPSSLQQDWIVYPNPAHGQLTVHSTTGDKAFHWSIFDSNGRLIKQHRSESSQAIIDLNDMSPAVYQLQITTIENITVQYKIIKNDIR